MGKNKFQGLAKKVPAVMKSWKKDRQKDNDTVIKKLSIGMKEKMDLAVDDVDITLIDSTKAKLDFGQLYYKLSYNYVSSHHPGYLSCMCMAEIVK